MGSGTHFSLFCDSHGFTVSYFKFLFTTYIFIQFITILNLYVRSLPCLYLINFFLVHLVEDTNIEGEGEVEFSSNGIGRYIMEWEFEWNDLLYWMRLRELGMFEKAYL